MASNRRPKNTNINEKKEECISYLHEILPDFQKRTRTRINNLLIPPEEKIMHVGMEEMSAKSCMGKYFGQFASNSSVHGFNHLVARHRHPFERFIATMFILVGFACFIYCSLITWYRYKNDSIIVQPNCQYERIRLVKPSVILSPVNLIEESKFPATFRRYNIEDTSKARAFFHFLSNITYYNMINTPEYEGAPPELWLRILNDLKREFYYETSLPGKGTWIASEDGIRFSIGNSLLPYLSLENMLANNWTVSTVRMYPPDISDDEMGNREIDDPNYVPSYAYYYERKLMEYVRFDTEALVHVSDPMDIWRVKLRGELVKFFEQKRHTVTVHIYHASKGLEELSKYRRQCGFPLDKGLKLYPIYSVELCKVENRAQKIKQYCGCYPHFFRQMPGVPVCNVTQLHCIARRNELKLILNKVRPNYNCLHNCNAINYDTMITNLPNVALRNQTGIEIKIIFPKYKYSITERYTFASSMASIGGIAGFFLGCSVLSFVEIFYYATLHFFIYKRKWKQK